MAKPYKKYEVLQKEKHDYGDGNCEIYTIATYETMARSEAEAINRVAWREHLKHFDIHPWCGDGARTEFLEAVEVLI